MVLKKNRPEFSKCCIWRDCPSSINSPRRYTVSRKSPNIVTEIANDGLCTIIGNTPLPHNKVTSWNIKILKSMYNDGYNIFIGVAPSDINQNEYKNYNKCGWYFDCFNSTLYSGPPHKYVGKKYGPRKENEEYVHTGDSVGVVIFTAKGELSFVVNGVSQSHFHGMLLNERHFTKLEWMKTSS